MSRSSVLNFLTGQPKDPRRSSGRGIAADIVGEGYFYKEGAKVKSWKYRKYTVFDNGHLMYFSPMRKLFKGEFNVKSVAISVPPRGSRSTRPVDVMLGEGAFELRLHSAAVARPLCLLFKTDEEALLFLYYLSVACTEHNVPALVQSLGKGELYAECERIVRAAQAHKLNHWSDNESDGTEESAKCTPPRTGYQAPGAAPVAKAPSGNIFLVSGKKPPSPENAGGINESASMSKDFKLSSPPPKKSAQPDLKAPVGTPARRASATESVLTDDRSDDGTFDDLLFFTLWNSNGTPNTNYNHPSVLEGVYKYILAGNSLPAITRSFWWRLSLGVLSSSGPASWAEELSNSVLEYQELRRGVLPVMSAATHDPLSSPVSHVGRSSGGSEWEKYYKAREKVNFIQLDINRLYLNDVDDTYFEDQDRRRALQNILVLWSTRHEDTAYRQGMHELAGALYYVVEAEAEAWLSAVVPVEGSETGGELGGVFANGTSTSSEDEIISWRNHPLRMCFSRDNVEAYVYWLFDRLMSDLECLYDPNPTSDGQPPVLHYCFAMQENLLGQIDADLCEHLEVEDISCQLYGMRWARLLLSREFQSMEHQVLRIWDFIFMFAFGVPEPSRGTPPSGGISSGQKEVTPSGSAPKHGIMHSDSTGTVESVNADDVIVLPSITACILDQNADIFSPKSTTGSADGPNLNWAPIPRTSLLAPLQFVMVSMLVQIRREILESDNNLIMTLLMRYPETSDVKTIIEQAHCMSRGQIRLDPKVVVQRTRKRDIVFKNLQKIGKFGSKVTQTIRRGSVTNASSHTQSAPSTPMTEDQSVTPLIAKSSSDIVATSIAEDPAGFEMEMNVTMGGLFSPPATSSKTGNHIEPNSDLRLYSKVSSLLSSQGKDLATYVSLAMVYAEKLNNLDDLSSSSDEETADNNVVRKKTAPLPPPVIDRAHLANKLRSLADVLEGKKAMRTFEEEDIAASLGVSVANEEP